MKLEIFIKEIEGESYLCLRLADLTLLKAKRKNFVPPTVEQVRTYCKERRNQVKALEFMDHYISNGWMVGKVKMKSWEAAVRKWERSIFNEPESKGTNLGDPPPEIFGVANPNATNMPQSLKDKFDIK